MNGNGVRILIVDDLRDAANGLAELLILWGYAVEPCYCGATALAAVRRLRPALILLDLVMAPMNGFTVATLIRATRGGEKVPIVAHSGHTSEEYRRRASLLGIVHYVVKPAEPRGLKALLESLVVVPPFLRSVSHAETPTHRAFSTVE